MNLHERFVEPGPEFRQAPFWFWNDELEPELLLWQIEQMREKGLGGFVMHARHGLNTPYLSEKWFDCIRACCERARELGMWPWAYDERDWPSGPAGGAVIKTPENRLKYLHFEVKEEGDAPQGTIAQYAGENGGWRQSRQGDKSAGGSAGYAVETECPAILWFDSYLDTLNASACDAFVQSTYEKHVSELGDLAALGLKGFFTDEPAFSTYPDDLRRIPWTTRLPEVFAERKGYDLMEYLPLLFAEGDAGAQVRFDYWDVAALLLEESFFKRISRWCEDRGLGLIGHPLGEEPLLYQFRTIGNLFRHLKHLQMPGMDHLAIQVGKGTAEAVVPKLVSSAALMAGRERTMTETFGESGWKLTLREMKWMADWQMANGINYLIPHAFYYSVSGRRKKDSPPSEFYQAPYWQYYRYFADYTARVTSVMTGGEHVAKIAVFYPMSSVWADFVPGEEWPAGVRELEEAFRLTCETLQRQHRDFVVVDEAELAAAEVVAGAFSVKGLQFEALVVPKMSAITQDALDSLKRIAEETTTLVFEPRAWRVLASSGPRDAGMYDPKALRGAKAVSGSAEDVAAALAGVTPDVQMERAPDVQYLHRKRDGMHFYFFANTGKGLVQTNVSLEPVGMAELWDAETGERKAAPGQHVENGRLVVPMDLQYAGSCLISVDTASEPRETPAVSFKVGRRIKIGGVWEFTPEGGNFLALNHWDLQISQEQHVTELTYSTHFMMPERIASLRLILDGVPAHAFNLKEGARPVLAGETDAVVLMDGEPVTEELPWDIDPRFRVLDLKKFCRPGSHVLQLVIKNNGWIPQPGLEEMAWLAGDFMLDLTTPLPCLTPVRGLKTGPWEEQGFPYFSGTGAYATEHELPEDIAGKRVILNLGKVGHLAEVEVNAEPVGVRPWPPYRLDITRYVTPGWNQFVLKVTNSAKNFFEGPDKNSGSGLMTDVVIEIEE
jgi:hypothetical protein